MAKPRRGSVRWRRCKCVPNQIDDNSRLQAKAHVKQTAERDQPIAVKMATEVAIFCGVTEEALNEYLMDHMTAHAWADAEEARTIIHTTYSEDTDNANA